MRRMSDSLVFSETYRSLVAMIFKSRPAGFLGVPVAALALTAIAGAGELGVSASTPEVSISTRPAGRSFLRLPSLQYEFVLETDCPSGLQAESLSLSIADTRISNTISTDSSSRIELSVNVPATQIGPIAVDQFCSDSSAADGGPHTLQIASVLSAQAALLCAGDSGSEMTYESKSLDVLLRCENDDMSETDPLPR